MIAFVDAHQHFQDLAQGGYPWLTGRDRSPQLEGDLSPLRRDYLPRDYDTDLAHCHVIKTVHVQNGWMPEDRYGETVWLGEFARCCGRPDAVVAFADLAWPDLEEVLDVHLRTPSFRGVRQILSWHADPVLRVAATPDLMTSAAWRRGFAALARRGLSFDLQIFWTQMHDALALARDFPDASLVLGHFGMPVDRSAEGIAAWRAAMGRLAHARNVTVKLSGFGLGHPSWSLADTVPLLASTIEMFGPERVMVGTNLPVDLLFASAIQITDAIAAVVAPLSESEQASVLRGTAERVYRI